MIGKIINFILFFLYLSNIQFTFMPDRIRTRLIVGVIGFIYYFFRFGGKDYYRVGKVVLLIMPLALWMFFSIALNTQSQFWFLQYVALQLIYAVGAVFVIHTGKLYEFSRLLWMVTIYVIIQDVVAFSTFLIPSLSLLLYSFQVPELSADRADDLLRLRAIGIGEFGLFGGGMWVAIGLLSLTMLYRMKKLRGIVYMAFFIALLITGLFVARTSLTGLLALSALVVPLKKNWHKVLIWAVGGAFFSFYCLQWKKVWEKRALKLIMLLNSLTNIVKQVTCNLTVMTLLPKCGRQYQLKFQHG